MKKISKYSGLIVAIFSAFFFAACGSESSSSGYNTERESGGVNFTNEYSSPEELGVGDIMYINFDSSGNATLDFAGVESTAKFILVVGSANESGAASSFQISSDLSAIVEKDVSAEINENEDYTADEILSAWLRAAEPDLAATEPPPPEKTIGMKAMSVFKAVSVGDTEEFRVLSNLSSTTTYTTVDGVVRCIGDAVIFYVDPRTSSDMLSDSDVSELCNHFNEVAQEEMALFGEPSDINGDGRVAVLMTPQINQLGGMGGGIITGYFWAGDLYARTNSNPVSNEREIIYTMVPDPSGIYGTSISKDFALSNLLPAVLPHELQHAINYNQHVFVKGGTPEQNWLNEGLSHLAEDLVGYGQENPSRYALFLGSTAYAGVVTMSQPNLYQRGASYLFLRYLYEQASSGDTFMANLENTSATGVENLERAFNGAEGFSLFYQFLARWTVALAVTDEGITNDSRYIYRERVRNSSTGNWMGVCMSCDADDGRGTILGGVTRTTYNGSQTASIAGSAAKFYNMSTFPPDMVMTGSSGDESFGVLIRQE